MLIFEGSAIYAPILRVVGPGECDTARINSGRSIVRRSGNGGTRLYTGTIGALAVITTLVAALAITSIVALAITPSVRALAIITSLVIVAALTIVTTLTIITTLIAALSVCWPISALAIIKALKETTSRAGARTATSVNLSGEF